MMRGWMSSTPTVLSGWWTRREASPRRTARATCNGCSTTRTPTSRSVSHPSSPDARTYRGLEGLIDAFLDWPKEWEDFHVEPTRISAVGDGLVIVEAVHRGRSKTMGIDVEAEIVWLYRFEDGLTRRWEMFMSRDAALRAARTD